MEKIYQEFKSVMEMVYVVQKMSYAQQSLSAAEIEEFNRNFVANMEKCQKSKKFRREYKDYELASAQGKLIIPPENTQQIRLNKILKEIAAIDLACQPYQSENKEIRCQQADTRLKYEKRLDNNLKANTLLSNKKEK